MDLNPNSHPPTHSKLARAVALYNMNDLSSAAMLCEQALAAQPDMAEALQLLGTIRLQQGLFAAAAKQFRILLNSQPHNAEVNHHLGYALAHLGNYQQAILCYDQALVRNANFTIAHNHRGIALGKLNRHEEAILSFGAAIALAPQMPEAHFNLGNAFANVQRHQEALSSFDRAIALKPHFAEALNNRGLAQTRLQRYDEAILDYQKALALKADIAYAPGAILGCKLLSCSWDRWQELTADTIEAVRLEQPFISPFNFLAVSDSPSDILRCAQNYVHRKVSAQPLIGLSQSRNKKIRLAYVSADFRSHPVGGGIVELLERHDRQRFDVIGISLGPDDGSPLRRRILQAFDQFHDVCAKSDEQVAHLMRDLQIDIAIDLNGHTEGSRPIIFAYRAAPIQITYLGFAGTTGADFIDYIIADKVVIPSGHERYYAENVVRMPNSYFPTDSKKAISSCTPSRAECQLPQSGFVFCCFNNSYKITPELFAIWMRLLAAKDGSVLWLTYHNDTAAQNLRRNAEVHGINSDRLVFAYKLPMLADHLARHPCADLFLDTLPFNAHTTACEALWAGLPVLTCAGASFASRTGASLLTAAGLPELITNNLQDYENLALELAESPELLASIKRKLASIRTSCALFDTGLLCQHLEAAFTCLLENWQRGIPNQNIDVGSLT